MGIKCFWKTHLGDFREDDRKTIAELPDKCIAVDTSSWVHQLDGIWDVQCARTSTPRHPHPATTNAFVARIRALKALGLHPKFVLDGRSLTMKKMTNSKRQKKSITASKQCKSKIKKIKAGTLVVTEEKRKNINLLRRGKACPTPEEHATLCHKSCGQDISCMLKAMEAMTLQSVRTTCLQFC